MRTTMCLSPELAHATKPAVTQHPKAILAHVVAVAIASWLKHLNVSRARAEIAGVPSPIEYGAQR